ncbi:transmembrane protein 248 [Stegastes partitus]|uniref:Transmembrane protein 248-like n=1 Tax=Stegastes partitus TaxID=144197 RepID=A0A3B5ASW4_9TELE|nr:PREDICTED: transmembrane protein 248-like [Stegastes partitus]
MMGFWQPVTNLREYVSQNPPGTTFFLCLLTLAISFICLSSYSSTHTLPNPDTTKDWNHLLSALSQFQLCVTGNTSSSELVSSVSSPLMEQEKDRRTSTNSTKSLSPITHLRLKVPLTVTSSSPGSSLKDLSLHVTFNASQLQLGGKKRVNLTLESLSGDNAHTCLTISAPTHLVPMSRLPPECPASEKIISPIRVEASNEIPAASQACYSLHSKNDPTLTVMLTREEQRVAVRHLLEVSGCLLAVCLMLCLAAGLTHSLTRRNQWNGLDIQNEPLLHT